jgi:23S rRNA pseudouridine1911/1915/1917 synthase
MNRNNITHLTVAGDEQGLRLDKLLALRLPHVSRARLKSLISEGRVREGAATLWDANHRVKPGEEIVLTLPEPTAAEPQPEEIPLAVVHEDEALIVIDKPAGLVVHPAPGHAGGTLVNALIAHCGASLSGIGGVRRPGIVHRLDKDTSGLLVVAKSDAAHRALSRQFAAHGADGRLHRAYLALVWGLPFPRMGRIAANVGRKASNRARMAVVREEEGRAAATRYEVLEVFGTGVRPLAEALVHRPPRRGKASAPRRAPIAALVRCVLETGRTHQVRVHMAHIGHPLLGDATYGAGFAASARRLPEPARAALARPGRQALHAAELAFEHPLTGRRMSFERPLPSDLAALLEALRRA